MNFQRGRKHEELEMNLVPLIDVLLVIIIFLVVSATFSRINELQINLPTADASKPPERVEQIEELRKRFQSLNQTFRRDIGGKPPIRRDDRVPDPCPELLDKLDKIGPEGVGRELHTRGLALLVIAIVSYRNIHNLIESDRWVAHTHQVRSEIADLLVQLVDAETGARGYVITGVESYLEPYQSALDRIRKDLDEVRTLTADNPQQQRRLGENLLDDEAGNAFDDFH